MSLESRLDAVRGVVASLERFAQLKREVNERGHAGVEREMERAKETLAKAVGKVQSRNEEEH